MATKVIDKFTGLEKTLYDGNEKRAYYFDRAKKTSGLSLSKRMFALGFLKRDKQARKAYKKANPDYVPKHLR